MFDFDRSLILIVGAQRSGTTWLQRLLASHPLIAAGPESHLFSGYLGPWWQRWQDEQRQRTDGGRTIGLACYLGEEEMLEEMRILTRRILGRARYLKPAAELIVEKTPDHGLQLPLIHALFPDATVVHIIRDGRDVVDSMLAAHETSWGRAGAAMTTGAVTTTGAATTTENAMTTGAATTTENAMTTGAATTTEDAAARWDHSVRTIRRDQKLFRRNLEIRYENLVEHGSQSLAEIFDFLGVPIAQAETAEIFERWRLADCQTNSVQESLVIPQHLRGGQLEPKGFFRAGRPGAWQETLTPSQQQAVLERAGPLLDELGYSATPAAAPPVVPTSDRMVSIASRDDAIFRHPKSLDVVRSTNAQMLPRERLYLYATVFALAPERCLEIGVCEGGSSRIIDAALEDVGSGNLISVDPCLQISDEFRDRLRERVTFLEGASPGILAQAQQRAGGPFQFVLVDGDHSQPGVLEDLRGVVEVTAPGAIVLAHDAYSEPVAAGIDEGLRSGLPFADGGIVSSTCHPMQQDGQVYNWGGFRLLVRTQAANDCGMQQARAADDCSEQPAQAANDCSPQQAQSADV